MKAVGIIAEYNPFHNGHLYQLNAAKRLTGREHAVIVMSGGYVQRGEPAIYDKWLRTRAALFGGSDVVIELPSYYSTAAANYFARGAVKILNSTGIVDCVCFGSECGEIEPLRAAADILITEPPEFKNTLKQQLQTGMSFAAARGAALTNAFASSGLFASPDLFYLPNNNLAMEYIKELTLLNSSMRIFTVPRLQNEATVSASAIRAKILGGHGGDVSGFIPNFSETEAAPRSLDDYSEFFKTFLYKAPELFKINLQGETENCLSVPDMDAGLLARFMRETQKHEKISEILAAVKTKCYTFTRLQRAVLHIILGITSGDMQALENHGGPPYLRILGYRKQSGPLIREIAANAVLPVVMDAHSARNRLSPFALNLYEREARGELDKPVVKI